MRELRSARHDVSDRVHVRLARALIFVNLDEAAIELDARAFQADVFRIRLAPHGNQQRLDFVIFLLLVGKRDAEFHAAVCFLNVLHARAGFDADAALLK